MVVGRALQCTVQVQSPAWLLGRAGYNYVSKRSWRVANGVLAVRSAGYNGALRMPVSRDTQRGIAANQVRTGKQVTVPPRLRHTILARCGVTLVRTTLVAAIAISSTTGAGWAAPIQAADLNDSPASGDPSVLDNAALPDPAQSDDTTVDQSLDSPDVMPLGASTPDQVLPDAGSGQSAPAQSPALVVATPSPTVSVPQSVAPVPTTPSATSTNAASQPVVQVPLATVAHAPAPSNAPAAAARSSQAPLTVSSAVAPSASLRPAAAAPSQRASAPAGGPSSARLAGVWTDGVDASASADLRSLGVGWARTSVSWSNVEPSQGVFVWGAADQSVAAASSGGSRNVLVLVRDNPGWAAASRCKLSSDGERGQLASFLSTLTTRYRAAIPDGPLAGTMASVKYWQLYNEVDNTSESFDQLANLGGCFGTRDGSYNATPDGRDSYARMLESAGSAIHAADPNAFVVMAGVASGNYARGQGASTCATTTLCLFDPDFLKGVVGDLQNHGTLDRLDMVAVHFFSSQAGLFGLTGPPDLIGRIDQLRSDMRSGGLSESNLKPIIVDESSYTDSAGSSTSSASDAFNLKQRNYLVKSLARAMYERVAAYFWFWLNDTSGGLGGDNAYGLRASDGGAKPAYAAMQHFASLLDQRTEFVGKLSLPSSLEGYEFHLPDGRTARVVWNETSSSTATVPYAVNDGVIVEATDASGAALNVADNTAQVGAMPVYLILGTAQNCRPGLVKITIAPSGGGLNVTINAASSTLPIKSLQFHGLTNAIVNMAGQNAVSSDITLALPSGSFAVTLTVRRAAAGASTTVPITIVDGCGTWETFVGGGAGAF